MPEPIRFPAPVADMHKLLPAVAHIQTTTQALLLIAEALAGGRDVLARRRAWDCWEVRVADQGWLDAERRKAGA